MQLDDHDRKYVCFCCGGGGQATRTDEEGNCIPGETYTCTMCGGTGGITEAEVHRHRLAVLSRQLAERAVDRRQDTPLKQQAFALEAEQSEWDLDTYTEVATIEASVHYESELGKLRTDLVEAIFDLLGVAKADRRASDIDDDEIPF